MEGGSIQVNMRSGALPSVAPNNNRAEPAIETTSRHANGSKRARVATAPLPRIQRTMHVEVDDVQELEKARNKGDSTALFTATAVADGFASLGICMPIVEQLNERFQFDTPTRIQSLAVPAFLKGGDLLAQSQTGSGKTLAFVIPILDRLLSGPRVSRDQGTLAIILSPTRELSLQTHAVVAKLAQRFNNIVTGIVMGGQKKKSEKASLRKGVSILVCTPGRLLDHMQTTESFVLTNCAFVVLDEADRLLDLGFEKDLTAIADVIKSKADPEKLQCALFSATLDKRVKKLGSIFLKNPTEVDCSRLPVTTDPAAERRAVGNVFDIPAGLSQGYVVVPERLRLVSLVTFLRWKIVSYSGDNFKAIIFVATCDQAEFYHRLFSHSCWPPQDIKQSLDDDDRRDLQGANSDADDERDRLHAPLIPSALFKLHGNMSPIDRTKVYNQFCKARGGLLFCTDVAARGLDLPSLDWIIQYNPPSDITDYVHRIGRTARLGRRGRSLIIMSQSEVQFVSHLQQNHINLEQVDLSDLLNTLRKEEFPEGVRSSNCNYSAMANQFSRLVDSDMSIKTLASRAFTSYNRAYAAYPRALRKIFNIQSVHLGHVASSFGLKQSPSSISNQQSYKKEASAAKDDDQYIPSGVVPAVRSSIEKSNALRLMATKKRKRSSHKPMDEFAA